MASTRSSLAKRIRNSAALSKIHLPRMPESRLEQKSQNMLETKTIATETPALDCPTKDAECQATLLFLEASSSSLKQETLDRPCYNTATVINKIINRINSISSDSPDRLRGLEIAEVCSALHYHSLVLKELVLIVPIKQAVLHSIECYKEAKLSAEKAKKHARDAELNVERASMELIRLQRLCEPEFDGETLQAIKELVKRANFVGEISKIPQGAISAK